jgi:hypothetical protein
MRTPADVSALSRDTGISAAELYRLREAARLADLDGLGAANANALRRLGITRFELLAAQDPASVCSRWRAEAREKPPTLPQVKAWIRAARRAVRAEEQSPEAVSAGPDPAAPRAQRLRGAPRALGFVGESLT